MYSLPVRLGEWYETTVDRNYHINKLMYERSLGLLTSQRLEETWKNLYKPVAKFDEKENVVYGTPYQFINRDFEKDTLRKKDPRDLCLAGTMDDVEVDKYHTLEAGCKLTAIYTLESILRNTFCLESAHPCFSIKGNVIYDESVYIKTVATRVPLYLTFMRNLETFERHPPITLTATRNSYSKFKISFWKPDIRYTRFRTIEMKSRIIFKHSATGRNLVVTRSPIPTVFGNEYEVTCATLRDSHKMETSENFWEIV